MGGSSELQHPIRSAAKSLPITSFIPWCRSVFSVVFPRFALHNYVPDGSYGVAAASVLSLQSLSVQALQPKHAPRAKALGQTAGYERAGKELALRDRATTQSSEPWGNNAECAPPPRDERGNRE